jgi:hypothetical protein
MRDRVIGWRRRPMMVVRSDAMVMLGMIVAAVSVRVQQRCEAGARRQRRNDKKHKKPPHRRRVYGMSGAAVKKGWNCGARNPIRGIRAPRA